MKYFKPLASVTLLSAILIGVGCSSLPMLSEHGLKADETRKVTVLHTNDNHGRFWKNRRGEYGMAARKTLIDSIRASKQANGDVVLLLSGGDINTGVPESDVQDAEPDFKGMQVIGYDAMAIGNHEFDNPLSVLEQQQAWVDFPFLSANIYKKSTGERLFESHKIFEFDGLKIAVMGLTTEDTIRIGNPEYLTDIEFRSPSEEAALLVPELRKQADLIIAVTHMGHYQNGEHSVNAPGDVALARAVPGIDLIIGGHSQEPVCMAEGSTTDYDTSFGPGKACTPDQQNGTWIMQAYEWGKYVGQADLTVSADKVTLDSYALIPVNLKVKKKDADGNTVKDAKGKTVRIYATEEIAQDAELTALLQPYQTKGEAGLNIKLGVSDGTLEGKRDVVRFNPTNLGFVVAEAQRVKVNADVAVMNSGGIRASLEAGDITYKDILTVQPFGNTVCSVDVSGSQLMAYLKVAASKPIDTGSYAQFAGVDIEINNNELISASINGKTIDAASTYRLALNSFLASGGDGYPKMDELPNFVNSGFVDADVLREFVEANTPIAVADFAPKNVNRK